jgi:hypothetical protein
VDADFEKLAPQMCDILDAGHSLLHWRRDGPRLALGAKVLPPQLPQSMPGSGAVRDLASSRNCPSARRGRHPRNCGHGPKIAAERANVLPCLQSDLQRLASTLPAKRPAKATCKVSHAAMRLACLNLASTWKWSSERHLQRSRGACRRRDGLVDRGNEQRPRRFRRLP